MMRTDCSPLLCAIVTILLSCLSLDAMGGAVPGDVRTALEEFAERQRDRKAVSWIPLVPRDVQERFAQFGDEAVLLLRQCVDGEGPVDPTRALVLLGCLRGEEGWRLLESYARGEDVRRRSQAIGALGSLDTKRSVSLLKELAVDDETAREATASLGSLVGVVIGYGGSPPGPFQEYVSVQTKPPPSRRALEALKALLLEKHCSERPRVFAILEAVAPEDVQRLLPQLAEDEDAEIRLRTAELLHKEDVPGGRTLARMLARDADANVRFAATEALVYLGDDAAIPALADFLDADEKKDVRKALRLARELDSIEGLHDRLVDLLSSAGPEAACGAAGILHYHRDERGFEFLVRELRIHRHPAKNALEWSITPDDLPALIPMMDDPDFDVRESVLRLLLSFDDERVLDCVLKNFWRYDGLLPMVLSMKPMMMRYISRFPNDEALRLLSIHMDRHRKLRRHLAEALSWIPNRGALPFLRKLLSEREDIGPCPELTGIARRGGKEDVELLLDCLDRSKPGRQLYQQATHALQVITGEMLEGDAWRAWWREHEEAFDEIEARIKSLSGPRCRESLFFLTHFGNERSREALRRELSRRRDKLHEAFPFARALALQGDGMGPDYLLKEGLSVSRLHDALAVLHEVTGIGVRRSFGSMPGRWLKRKARELREYFAGGGGLDLDWRRRFFAGRWERNQAFLRLDPANPALDAVLKKFPSVPANVRACLTDPDGLVRSGALSWAGRGESAWHVPVFKAMLRDRDYSVRCQAAQALSRLKGEDIADTMIELLGINNGAIRHCAARWLGKNRVKRAIPLLMELHEKAYEKTRSDIVWALAEMGDDSLLEFFARASKSHHAATRDGAVRGLSRMPPELALPHLKKACADSCWWIRYEAVKAVYAMEGPESYDWFLSCTRSPEPTLRAAGLFGVLHHKDRPFPRKLVWKMLHDDDPSARMGAMNRLGEGNIIGDARIPLLQSYLREADNDPKLRLKAAEHLAIYGDPLAVSEAVRLLKGDDRRLVWEARRILERLGTLSRSPGAVKAPVLERILTDSEMKVDALSVAVRLAGRVKDRRLLSPLIALIETGLDKMPVEERHMRGHQTWRLLRDICSALEQIAGRQSMDPGAVSSERDAIVTGILEWWKEQPESREEE